MTDLEWTTEEYEEPNRSIDWYWGVGLVGLSGAILAGIFGTVVFALFILVGTGALLLQSIKRPRRMTYRVHGRGIQVGDTLYPYTTLNSFWITHDVPQKLLVESDKFFMPLLSIPLGGTVDPVELREFLLAYLDEEEHTESLAERVMEYFGF